MEWTWRQQLYMLLQSGGVGFLLGVVYDLLVTVGRVRRFTRPAIFIRDALFGVIAALVTFYFSLAIMDGQLHPLLFVGILGGFGVQRASISHLFCCAAYRLGMLMSKGLSRSRMVVSYFFAWLLAVFGRLFRRQRGKYTSNCIKKVKIFRFFQKNS